MIRVSKLADYGTVVMVYMARDFEKAHNARDIALHTHIALPTVSKLLKLLTRGQLLTSQRGAKGGYQLARHPGEISVAQILAAIEDHIAMTDCSHSKGLCTLEPICSIRSNWRLISTTIYHALECLTLADMAKPLNRAQIKISTEMLSSQDTPKSL